MIIVPRREWGARHEAGAGPAPLPASQVWLHHSVTVAPDLVEPFDDEHAAMRTLEEIGEARFGRGISYTFAVMPTGRVYEGHGVDRLGAHTKNRNGIARAIVLVGNYDVAQPTPQQIEAAAALLVHGQRSGWWTQARLSGGHQQVPGAATACPGRNAMNAIHLINARATELATIDQEDDELTEDQHRMLQAVFDILTPGIEGKKTDGEVLRRLRSAEGDARAAADALTPGVQGVKHDGATYTAITRLERTVTAQAATIDGLGRLLASWSGLQLDDIKLTIEDAIERGLAAGVDVDVTVGQRP